MSWVVWLVSYLAAYLLKNDSPCEPFPDPRPFPLKIFVSGNAALWLSTMLAVSWWEEQLFGDSRKERIATFVQDEKEADIIIASGSYIDRSGRHYRFGLWDDILSSDGLTWLSNGLTRPVIILLRKSLSIKNLSHVLRHELGHAIFGFGHNPDGSSIMYYASSGKNLVTSRDYTVAVRYLIDHGVPIL